MFYTFSTILVSQYKTLEYNSYINLCFQYINNELNVTNTRLLHWWKKLNNIEIQKKYKIEHKVTSFSTETTMTQND